MMEEQDRKIKLFDGKRAPTTPHKKISKKPSILVVGRIGRNCQQWPVQMQNLKLSDPQG